MQIMFRLSVLDSRVLLYILRNWIQDMVLGRRHLASCRIRYIESTVDCTGGLK